METELNSIQFQREWYESFAELDEQERLAAYEAVFNYAFRGEEPENRLIRIATKLIFSEIDSIKTKIAQIKQKRIEAGRKGGVAKQANLANASKCYQKLANLANDFQEKNKTKKEEIPPHPPIEEKNKTKKEDFTENQRFSTHKNVCVCACEEQDGTTEKKETKAPPKAPLTIDERKEEFHKAITPYEEKYGKEMCENFFDYWSEYNRGKTKMRCELQKTWQVSKRLATWAKNDYRVNQPSIVYGTSTTSGGYISRQKQQERERAEREAETYRAMQELAASDGGTPLAPLQ